MFLFGGSGFQVDKETLEKSLILYFGRELQAAALVQHVTAPYFGVAFPEL